MTPSPSGPPPPQPGGPPATPPPRGGRPGRIWLAVFLILLAWNAIILFAPATDNTVELPYSAFLAEAKANNVAQVTINGQAIDGTFRRAIPWRPAGSSPAPAGSLPAAASPGNAASPTPTYSSFSTVAPPLGDPVLLPLLESNGVTISAKNVSGTPAPKAPSRVAALRRVGQGKTADS